MKDDSISDDDGSKSDSELYASLDSLAINGQRPEVGDRVQLQVEGTIKSIDEDGDVACIEPETVNGEPMPKDEKEEDMEKERKRLQAKAEKDDSAYIENEMPGANAYV